MTNEDIKITLKHPGAEDIVLDFDPLIARKGEWLKYVLILPWTTPQRTIGFIHPQAEADIDVKPFKLFAAFSYYASVGLQPTGSDNKMRVVEGPKAVLPVDLIAPIDLTVGKNVPTWMFLRDQSDDWKAIISAMMSQTLVGPSKVEAPPPGLITP